MPKFLPALLCFSLIIPAAWAANPAPLSSTDTYIMARDRYIAEFAAEQPSPDLDRRHDRALADLKRRLSEIVPPWSSSGFSGKPTSNIWTLYRELDFGRLDGLLYSARGASVVVTSVPLLRHWIAGHRQWWRSNDVPTAIPGALRSEAFYTQAISSDAAAYFFAEVPVARPGNGEITVVRLALFTNGEATGADPDTLVASVVRGNRVFVAQQKLLWSAKPSPVCQSALKRALDKLGSEDQADRDYRACFAAHLSEQPHYKEIVRQAQALVDLLH